MVNTELFGTYRSQPVQAFTLSAGALSLRVLEYGATLQSLVFDGVECLLGYDDLQGYVNGGSFQGATIGRYANRIGGAAFPLGGEVCRLVPNENGNTLHGGPAGFNTRLFRGRVVDDCSVALSLHSPHLEGGFPGALDFTLTLRVSADPAAVTLRYEARCDRDTVMNFTNHAYFTLGGAGVNDMTLKLAATHYLPVNDALLPLSDPQPVAGTPFDFTAPKAIGKALAAHHPQLALAGGIDHNYVLGQSRGYRKAVAEATCPATGITLACSTDLPGLQVYTGNQLNEPTGRGGQPLCRHAALCLETQFFPDSPNHPAYPSCFVKAGELFTSRTCYAFRRG